MSTVIDIGAIPFPNDGIADESGEFVLDPTSLPFDSTADADALAGLTAALTDQDCFGVTGGVSFPLAGLAEGERVDLTAAAAATSLVDLGTGEAVAVEVSMGDNGAALFVRPVRGTVLAHATTYGAIVMNSVTTTEGTPLTAPATMAAVLSPNAPSSGHLADMHRAYAPLRDHLSSRSIAADDVVAASVFTTCDFARDFADVSEQIESGPAPTATVTRVVTGAELEVLFGTPVDNTFPGNDNEGGIAHASIGHVVMGTFDSPNYQSAVPGEQGIWQYDTGGAPVAKGTDDVPFVLTIPSGLASLADVPVVLYLHGLSDSKTQSLYVANSLAAAGYATISFDLPFHGGRYPNARDRSHNFTGEDGADGLADSTGPNAALYLFDVIVSGDVTWLDPRAMSDAFRQAVVDALAVGRLIADGDISSIRSADAALAQLSFRADTIPVASESFGGFVGVPALAFGPRYHAGFLSVAGGGFTTQFLEHSPVYGPLFAPIIEGAFSVSPQELDRDNAPVHSHPLYNLMATALDRADPLTYAQTLRAAGVQIVLPAALDDDAVPNPASEALAAALGLSWKSIEGSTDGPKHLLPGTLPDAAADQTRHIFTVMSPASHGMLTRARDTDGYSNEYPFPVLDPPVDIVNPIAALQAMLVEFARETLAP